MLFTGNRLVFSSLIWNVGGKQTNKYRMLLEMWRKDWTLQSQCFTPYVSAQAQKNAHSAHRMGYGVESCGEGLILGLSLTIVCQVGDRHAVSTVVTVF